MKASVRETHAPLTRLQKRIQASVESAKQKVTASADCRTRLHKEINAAGADLAKKDDAAMFGALKIIGPAMLDDPKVLYLVQLQAARAVAQRDGKMLIRLGRALQGTGTGTGTRMEFDKLDLWLIGAWLPQSRGMFGLCDCTDEVITTFLKHANGRENLTVEAVVKRRQRLGLVKSRKPAVTGVKMEKGKAVFSFR
jgi:hypothetical protein